MLDKETLTEYEKWINSDILSREMKVELEALKDDPEEIKYRFSSSLSFGTAGLRGIMAAGTNNMNIYTVGRATQGFADYINLQGGGSCVVAYDTRNNSRLFAQRTAEILAANKIKVFIFDSPRPTPELSFAVRELGCIAGINITASHNPKEYNGYKAYWSDGAQISPEQANEVSRYINKCDVLCGAKSVLFEEGIKSGDITILGEDFDDKYVNKVLEQRINKAAICEQGDMAVVYTPLHGTGYKIIPHILKLAGLKNLITVPEQMITDGDFPTVKYPNPEFSEAFVLGQRLALENNCDLIIATDPDADRMGIMIRDGSEYVGLTGNQVGCLLLDYIITAYNENGGVPDDAYAVKSIVTTELASKICQANGVKMFDVLTGFKFIGEVIKRHEEQGEKGTYLLGFEESYGYLKGTYARDKDAAVASLLVVEMAAYYRKKGMTLKDAVDSLYARYGSYGEDVMNIYMPGSDGKEKMNAFMKGLREKAPETFGDEPIKTVRDYLCGSITDMVTGETVPTGLPSSNVMYYTMENSVVVFRPSGTEPKIKIYFMATGKDKGEIQSKIEKCRKDAENLILK